MEQGWRHWELDGRLLRFQRETGLNQLLTGAETARMRQRAPRFLHVALTNECNKRCAYCYRPAASASLWTADGLLELARWAAGWGVLELTFGGGEPLLFPRFDELLRRIWDETPLCPSFTTNGLLLSPDFLRAIDGRYGQIQLSVHEDEAPEERIRLLAAERARFGLNVLVTRARLRTLETDVHRWLGLGARDVLLLSYKGDDPDLHLDPRRCRQLVASVERLRRRFGHALQFKVDVCWRDRLDGLPQLLDEADCGAGDSFLSITSDRRVQPCSFHHRSEPFETLDEIPAIYRRLRNQRPRAAKSGCGRDNHPVEERR